MCIICIDLIKHRMTLLEAERALDEIVKFTNTSSNHQIKLRNAIKNFDIFELDKTIDEGTDYTIEDRLTK